MVAGRTFDPDVFTDIHATASRGLIPGFLVKLPEEARQNYELASPVYTTHRFGGIVRAYHPDEHLAKIEVKNTLTPGDTIEFVSPRHIFSQKIQTLLDLAHKPITNAHGGSQNVLVGTKQPVAPMTILRICGT
jgi:hypothetical protein